MLKLLFFFLPETVEHDDPIPCKALAKNSTP